jgi:teichuronic acid biosynthesis glycosyltransferase TuaC
VFGTVRGGMRILVVTNMYPTKDKPAFGIFVREQVDSLREMGVDVDVFSFEGGGRVAAYLGAIPAFRRALRKESYDLVHAHYGLSGFVAMMQTCCPVVVTFHGHDLIPDLDADHRAVLRSILATMIGKLVALIVADCIVVADILQPKLWFRSAATIPMGVDLSLFRPAPLSEARRHLGITDKTKRVLFVADPKDQNKRFYLAQQAVHLLRKNGLMVELLYLLDVPHENVPEYMNACDVLVLTSKREASPCVIKEAMACNLPIVSTNVGDVAERINGVEGCYLCEPTPQDIAEKLRLVLSTSRRSNGRANIQDLSLQNVAQKVVEVYRNILLKKV